MSTVMRTLVGVKVGFTLATPAQVGRFPPAESVVCSNCSFTPPSARNNYAEPEL